MRVHVHGAMLIMTAITAMQCSPPAASKLIFNQWSQHVAAAGCVEKIMAAQHRALALGAIIIMWARTAATSSCAMEFSA
jgi:hypothetical protein